jgi:aminopeptidase N
VRGKITCRFCEAQSQKILGQRVAGGSRRAFAVEGSTPHYAPDRPFRIEHILLDVAVDPEAKTLQGTVTQKIKTVMGNQSVLTLDQIGIEVEEVKIQNDKLSFSIEGQSLKIQLNETPAVGSAFEVMIRYRLNHPQRGIYFTGPDKDYPNKPYQVWTQGQDEDSRYWFPTLDYPNQKVTSEVIATVPKGYTAVSNGALLSRTEVAGGIRYHYCLGSAHVTYLITLVVAKFAEWSDPGPRGLPVQYFVAPGREEEGKRTFGNTPQMIAAFEKKTGVDYPYEKYSQVAVQDFIFGGMENTSATTQTDLVLHDERAHLDFTADPLVAHELAHQWFGDLLTCRDWSHGWLNEGFATFMERVWVESKPGPTGGLEEAKYYSYLDLGEYLSEDHGRYRRPIVSNQYIEPIDLFDTHLYQKGGLVVNLIRYVLGEDLFWKSIQHYLTKHRGQNVETLDLIRAIEDTTGRNLRQLFDEWVFGAGYPEFEVSYQWHDDKKLAEWVIEQKQTGGATSVTQDGATTHLFHLPVFLEMTLENGQKVHYQIDLKEARDRVFLPAETKPMMVRFDPNLNIPKTIKFPRPKEMLLFQLKNDADCMGRIEAAQELVKIADPEITTALGQAALKDKFWGVQVESAKALSEIRSDLSRDLIVKALETPEPRARRAIALAVGTFRDPIASAALKKVAEKDASYFVEADATYAWAISKFNSAKDNQKIRAEATEAVEKFLLSQLEKPSYRDIIRASALKGLGELPGIAQGERSTALDTLFTWARRGQGVDVRGAAVRTLGGILRHARSTEREKILDLFSQLADESNFRLRLHLIGALDGAGVSQGISILDKIRQIDSDGRVKRLAQSAVDGLRTSGGVPDSVTNLRETLQKLEEEYRKLRSVVEEQVVVRTPMK